jgi:RNA polymerase sigma factor (sigma-70 family)
MNLISLIKSFRKQAFLAERDKIAELVYFAIERDMRIFVVGKVPPNVADDVFQEILKTIIINLSKFRGGTEKSFFAWCYQIARNKASDQHRKLASDRLQSFPSEELLDFCDSRAEQGPISPQDKMDLEEAMNLLAKSKPECREFLWSYYVTGFKYGEIGKIFNLKSGAVRMKIKRCLKTARKLLEG